MQTVLLTGGTGLIGKHLTRRLLKDGYEVIIMTRDAGKKPRIANVHYATWDVKKQIIDVAAISGADVVIHLAGAGVVAHRWTEKYKKEIVESRTHSSRLIMDTLRRVPHKVKTFVSASAIGWYGPDTADGFAFTENDPAATDFLGATCKAWEESIAPARGLGIRVCEIRTGIVLSPDGGILTELRKPLRSGIAGILGKGKQIISWIHIDDLCRIYLKAIQDNSFTGSYNAVASFPVNNKDLTLTFARKLRGNFFVPMHVPPVVLKLLMGESSIEVLKSATVSNAKIRQAGFIFLYPSLDAALGQLLQTTTDSPKTS